MIYISDEELIKISATAFQNIVLHTFRFWSPKPTGEKKIVYGLLMGYIEKNTRIVKRIIPLTHSNKTDFLMDDKFMKDTVELINEKELEKGSIQEVIGWYRSSNRGKKFTAPDIKNQIKYQEKNSKFIALILAPDLYLDPEESGFSVFRLIGEKYYNFATDFYKITWEIQKIVDIYEVIGEFQKYLNNYFKDQPLIMELGE